MRRRDWIARSTLASALIGLPPAWRAELRRGIGAGRSRPYLDLALRAARWIERSRQTTDRGAIYPADPRRPESVGLDFYNGMPGVVAFQAALAKATSDAVWLDRARSGADSLIHEATTDQGLDAGLYTGLAGIGYALDCVAIAGGGARYLDAANRVTDLVRARARRDASGVRWSDSWDVISGVAGTGLYLLHAASARRDPSLLALAADAGRTLLAVGESAGPGTMWFPAASFRRNYPNFSHGTSGVGYFLASLHRETKERIFLDGAIRAARYLDMIATREDGGIKVFHQDGGGENRYYLSWCHGPVGTARLFHRLHQITGDEAWLGWIDGLTKAVVDSKAPEERSPGFWNNISQCCGSVGIGQYCIDLARYRPTPRTADLVERVVADTMRRASDDKQGLRWIQAENRTQPDNLVAQTGFMQGAAGVGTFFLQLDAFQQGTAWAFPQPDTPWVG